MQYQRHLLSVVDRRLLHNICWCPTELFTECSMSTAVSCWEWIMGARQDLELQVSPSSCLYHLWEGEGVPHHPWDHSKDWIAIHEKSIHRVKITCTISMGTLECVASVSIWFRSKERPRNGIFVFWPREKWPPSPPAVLLAPFFALSLTLVLHSLLRNAQKCLLQGLWTHKISFKY